MKNEFALLFRYVLRLLCVVGPVEWLLGRTLSRISGMLSPGPVADGVNALAGLGLHLLEPSHVLALAVLALAAAWPWLAPAPPGWSRLLPAALAAFLLLSLAAAVIPASSAWIIGFNLLSGGILVSLALACAGRGPGSTAWRVAVGLLGLGYAGSYLYVIGAELAKDPTAPPSLADVAVAVHFAGEALVVAWAVALVIAVAAGRRVQWGRLALACVPGVAVAIAPLFETWLQGVLVRMSLGFTLFLPSPLYALAVTAYAYALLTVADRRAGPPGTLTWRPEIAAALLLLPVAGFDLLSNYQHAVALLALLLLTGRVRPFSAVVPEPMPTPAGQPQPPAVRPAPR